MVKCFGSWAKKCDNQACPHKRLHKRHHFTFASSAYRRCSTQFPTSRGTNHCACITEKKAMQTLFLIRIGARIP
jgi:hypothetical protein